MKCVSPDKNYILATSLFLVKNTPVKLIKIKLVLDLLNALRFI